MEIKKSKIKKVSNSFVLTLSPTFLKKIGINEDEVVYVNEEK